MTHITGGGFYENIPRALPEDVTAEIDVQSFPTPAVFDWLQKEGNIETQEMYNIFNMGIGFTLVVDEADAKKAMDILKEQNVAAYQIGKVVEAGDEPIVLTGVKA